MNRPPRKQGTEPANARSALGLRMVLSAGFLPLFAAAAAGFGLAAAEAERGRVVLYAVLGVLCAVLTVVALADIMVVVRRRRGIRH